MADLGKICSEVLFIHCAEYLSIFGDTQKLSGYGARQPALGHLVWAEELDGMTSRGSSESQLLPDYVTTL